MTKQGDHAPLAIAEVATQRNDGKCEERRNKHDVRRKLEDETVGALRNEVFFEEQLCAIGECLQQTPWAGLVGSDAVLHASNHFAFEPHHQHGGHKAHHKNDKHFHQDDEKWGPQQLAIKQWVKREN